MDSRDGTVGLDHRRLQDEAVTWLVRRDGNEWSQETQTQFDDWLAQSTAHRVAFLRLEAGWEGGKKERHLMALPAYDQCIKASHVFNLLDARGVISVTERQSYILRVRELAKACGEAWLATAAGGA